MTTRTEVLTGRNQDRLTRAAIRMQAAAYSGQTYNVEQIDATLFAVVLSDTQVAPQPITSSHYRRGARR